MLPFSTDRRNAERPDPTSRRTRLRLRELCDEVLASYRAARGHEPVTAEDRAAAVTVLSAVGPKRPR